MRISPLTTILFEIVCQMAEFFAMNLHGSISSTKLFIVKTTQTQHKHSQEVRNDQLPTYVQFIIVYYRYIYRYILRTF